QHGVQTAPFVVNGPVELEVDVSIPAYADQAMVVPGIRRIAGRTLGYNAPEYLTAYRITRLIGALSGLPL
ncbi:MAG: M55 family metallopeptidase, partial [Chloroflexota bacterium]|nr:M55 family metallopeptidase [Chloroflexota bacterium]